jgi:hypothetical protein
LKQRNRRGSDSSIRKSQQYEPLIKVNPHGSKRDGSIARPRVESRNNNEDSLKMNTLSKKLTVKRKKNNKDEEDDDEDYDV